ncbi:hypothetical protein F5Y03DRAFT_391061 [Xylaria venustula]|nr:hypothetical protein F5Y03DRAFT_391061 [Xylaria venustula]
MTYRQPGWGHGVSGCSTMNTIDHKVSAIITPQVIRSDYGYQITSVDAGRRRWIHVCAWLKVSWPPVSTVNVLGPGAVSKMMQAVIIFSADTYITYLRPNLTHLAIS